MKRLSRISGLAVRTSRLLPLALVLFFASSEDLEAQVHSQCYANCNEERASGARACQLQDSQCTAHANDVFDAQVEACVPGVLFLSCVAAAATARLVALGVCSLNTQQCAVIVESSYNSCVAAFNACSCTGGSGPF